MWRFTEKEDKCFMHKVSSFQDKICACTRPNIFCATRHTYLARPVQETRLNTSDRGKSRTLLEFCDGHPPAVLSLVTQPTSSPAMIRSDLLQAQCHSLPGALECRLGLVLLELTKRRPRVSKRIQPVWRHRTVARESPRNSSPKLGPEQPKAPPRAQLFATSKWRVSRYVDGAPPMS